MAASNLEKAIFDCSKSNISYKAAIVNRRKEVMKATENFQIHSSFLADQTVKAKNEVCPVAAGMFQKASDMLTSDKSPEKENVAEKKNVPTFMSTSDRLRRLKKPKEKKTNLSKAEQDLMLKYLKPKVETKHDIKLDQEPNDTLKTNLKVEEKPEIQYKMEIASQPELGLKPNEAMLKEVSSSPESNCDPPEKTNVDNFTTKMPTLDQIKVTKPAQKGKIPLFQQKLAAQKSDRLTRLKRLNQLTGEKTSKSENLEGRKRKLDENGESDSKKMKIDDPRKVRFHSGEKEDAEDSNKKDYSPNDLESCKRLVLKVISPYFTSGRFSDKKFFKELAKRITKELVSVNIFFNLLFDHYVLGFEFQTLKSKFIFRLILLFTKIHEIVQNLL